MSDIQQLKAARWERIKQGGAWRFVLLRGVLGWGLSMSVAGIIFEHVSRKEEALAWYLILGLCLAGGFVWGLAMWVVMMWSHSRSLKLTRRQKLKNIAGGIILALAPYLVAYTVNSAAGGYWMIPERDGYVRFKQEYGGLSMTVAIMWQPRLGHNALGTSDNLGSFFEPFILLDRAWIHPTHYIIDRDFDAWTMALPPSKVHPKLRDEFVRVRTKAGA